MILIDVDNSGLTYTNVERACSYYSGTELTFLYKSTVSQFVIRLVRSHHERQRRSMVLHQSWEVNVQCKHFEDSTHSVRVILCVNTRRAHHSLEACSWSRIVAPGETVIQLRLT